MKTSHDHYLMKNGILTINSKWKFHDWLARAYPVACIQGLFPDTFYM